MLRSCNCQTSELRRSDVTNTFYAFRTRLAVAAEECLTCRSAVVHPLATFAVTVPLTIFEATEAKFVQLKLPTYPPSGDCVEVFPPKTRCVWLQQFLVHALRGDGG